MFFIAYLQSLCSDSSASDTKEKPFVCQCGAAFTRRDLLTRHQKLSTPLGHGTLSAPTNSHVSDPPEPDAAAAETAAAASLSGMSMDSWANTLPLGHRQQNSGQYHQPVAEIVSRPELQQPLPQPLLAHDFYETSECYFPGSLRATH